jgi:hypothetical protein
VGKLHETLAVEDSLSKVFKAKADDTLKAFTADSGRFAGARMEVTALREDQDDLGQIVEGTQESLVAETVPERLDALAAHTIRYLDAVAQKEGANQKATADLTIGVVTLIENAPATLLLALENRLKILRSVLAVAPVHDMSSNWTETGIANVFAAPPDEKIVTRKTERAEVVIQPTEHQAGQYRTYTEDVPIAKRTVTRLSGEISPAAKDAIVSRCDRLILACKKSRQRANEEQIEDVKIGRALLGFILDKEITE